MNKNKVVFFATRDWIIERFYSNKISYFIENNFEVIIICKITQQGVLKKNDKLKIINFNLHKTSINFFIILREIFLINKLILSIKPNVIINCGMKPILISFPFSLYFSKSKIINSIIGLGNFFNKKMNILQLIAIIFFRLIFKKKNNYFIVETFHLKKRIVELFHISEKRVDIVGGIGIDEKKFVYNYITYNKFNKIKFLTVSRLLKDKGIEELYYCIKYLSKNYKDQIEFTIIGNLDEDNPNNISLDKLEYFKSNPNYINYFPNSNKINLHLEENHILIHPSYHEGLSVICQEAVCVGRGIIASNISGCNEIVKNKFNGLLVNPKDKEDLLKNIFYVLNNPSNINYFNQNSSTLRDKYLKKSIINKINNYFQKIILYV